MYFPSIIEVDYLLEPIRWFVRILTYLLNWLGIIDIDI